MQPVLSLLCNLHLNASGLAATLDLTAALGGQLAIWVGHAMLEGDLDEAILVGGSSSFLNLLFSDGGGYRSVGHVGPGWSKART